MKVLVGLLLGLSTAHGEVYEYKLKDVSIKNNVSQCLRVIPQEITKYKNISTLSAKLESIKSTGECGCVSGLLEYSFHDEKFRGQFKDAYLTKNRVFHFVLETDEVSIDPKTAVLKIRCSRAE